MNVQFAKRSTRRNRSRVVNIQNVFEIENEYDGGISIYVRGIGWMTIPKHEDVKHYVYPEVMEHGHTFTFGDTKSIIKDPTKDKIVRALNI